MKPEHWIKPHAHVRHMIRRDLPQVLQGDLDSFPLSAWMEDDFLRCLRQRNVIGMVAVNDNEGIRVVGHMLYELRKHNLHVLNFAVYPAFRRRQVGAQMVKKLVGKLSAHRRNRITLEVRESNLEAQLFFRKMGFRGKGVLHRFYEDSGEDAFLMEYRLADEPPKVETVNRISQYYPDDVPF